MQIKLVSGFVVKPFNKRFFEGAVHLLNGAIRPGVSGLGKALHDAPFVTELPNEMAAHLGICGK